MLAGDELSLVEACRCISAKVFQPLFSILERLRAVEVDIDVAIDVANQNWSPIRELSAVCGHLTWWMLRSPWLRKLSSGISAGSAVVPDLWLVALLAQLCHRFCLVS